MPGSRSNSSGPTQNPGATEAPKDGPMGPEELKAMIVTTNDLFRHAYGNYAVGAYNINNLEQTVGSKWSVDHHTRWSVPLAYHRLWSQSDGH